VAEFGHIDVDQGAGPVVFVSAQWLAGDAVDSREPVDSAPYEHGVHGGGGDAQPAGDLDRPQAVSPAQSHDLADHHWAGAVRARAGPGAAIGQARPAVGAVTVRTL